MFLAIVFLLKELGVFQSIKRFFNEVNEKTKKDESLNEEKDKISSEENKGSEDKDESEDTIGSEVDSNVEEASEESFEENVCSDKKPVKSEKEEPKKEVLFFGSSHADPEVIPKTSMKNGHVIMFEAMNKYPRLIYIDERTSRIEESPKDFFYCTTKDMPVIRMMPEKEQIEYLRMRMNQIRSH